MKDGAGAAGAVGLVDSDVFISATIFDHLNFSSSMFKLRPTNRLQYCYTMVFLGYPSQDPA